MSLDTIKIYCPKCSWKPDGNPYWKCSCDEVWDTFSTGGRCPRCSKVWEDTQCIQHAGGCNAFSPHLDWYNGLDEVIENLKEEINEHIEAAVKTT